MENRSSLARLQQVLLLGLGACATAWACAHWGASPWRAAAGACAIAFSYAGVLALQCVLLRSVSKGDTSPRPSARELLSAWWGEVRQFPQVFYWRQPFRWREVPDSLGPEVRGRRGVVFIHGFMCNRGFWTPWMRSVRERGHGFAAVNLEPVFGSIDGYAPIIDAAVRDVERATGMPALLVCHSMGGLAARAWLRGAGESSRVCRVVTIGTPHHGTWLARFSHLANGRQMRLRQGWTSELASHEDARLLPPFTCWYTHCDNIVFPTSSATLPWADNRLVRGAAHVELAFVPEVVEGTLAFLSA